MKHMTSAQIDELNTLLEKHGETLTAFYNEGMAQGAKNVTVGVLISTGVLLSIRIIKTIIETHKERES